MERFINLVLLCSSFLIFSPVLAQLSSLEELSFPRVTDGMLSDPPD